MKISVIVPVYNVGRYLPQCLDSIRMQTFTDWEAILVDDGATDDSGEICDSYAREDPRFRVLHKQNGGAASAKNMGLDHVRGTFTAFIDSDDYVDRDWLLRLVHTAEAEDADVVEYRFDNVYISRSEPQELWSSKQLHFTAEQYLGQYLTDWSSSLFCNKLIRTTLIGETRFRRERRCIDDEFFTYKVLTNAGKIVRIPDILYHYRQRASSAVSSEKNQKQIADDALEVLIERYQWITARFPALRAYYIRHDVNILFFFADFHHTEKTADKFHRIAKFYLGQTIRYWQDFATVRNAVRLQFINNQTLLACPSRSNQVQQNLKDYFE